MLKTEFKDQLEFDIYLAEQKVRKENKCLTVSERKQLETMLDKNYKPIFIKEKIKLPLVTDIVELRKPCQEVTKEDNISEIVQKLKNSLTCYCDGIALSANQIGINKRISYIKIPKIIGKKIEFTELVLINARILEKDRPVKITNERCLSFSGIPVTTVRYVFITVEFYNEKMELQTRTFQDIESFVIQHETDHCDGKVIFDRQWRSKYGR
jgi:peptide deformylase